MPPVCIVPSLLGNSFHALPTVEGRWWVARFAACTSFVPANGTTQDERAGDVVGVEQTLCGL